MKDKLGREIEKGDAVATSFLGSKVGIMIGEVLDVSGFAVQVRLSPPDFLRGRNPLVKVFTDADKLVVCAR